MRQATGMLIAIAAVFASAASTQAGYVTYSTADVGGFVPNSASGNAAFLAAIGTPDEFLSFSTDKFGNPVPGTPVAGNIFSNNVTFSTKVSLLGFGGSSSPLVNSSGAGPGSEIGPVGLWNGVLNIDFLAAGQTAAIVGFGPVLLGTLEQIRIYDQGNALIATLPGVSNADTNFFGVQGTGGTEIGRIELDGNFFAIQDMQFDLAAQQVVPEPTSLALLGLGGIGLAGGWLRKRKGRVAG